MRRSVFACLAIALWCLPPGAAVAQPEASPQSGACVTVVNDPTPPANVRISATSPVVVDTLKNGTALTVSDDIAGWLHITTPDTGWIYLNLTSVECGDNGDVAALERRAVSDRVAADTLVRYELAAEGAASKYGATEIGALMKSNPQELVSVLEQLPSPMRRKVLTSVLLAGASDAELRAFDKAVVASQSMPTLSTWESIAEHCKDITSAYPWFCK